MIENIATNIQYSIKTTIINTKCQKDIPEIIFALKELRLNQNLNIFRIFAFSPSL